MKLVRRRPWRQRSTFIFKFLLVVDGRNHKRLSAMPHGHIGLEPDFVDSNTLVIFLLRAGFAIACSKQATKTPSLPAATKASRPHFR